jgi:hypothetical protein
MKNRLSLFESIKSFHANISIMKHISMFNCVTAISVAIICFVIASYHNWERVTISTVTEMMGFSPQGDYFLSERRTPSESLNSLIPEQEEDMWEESAYHNLPKAVQRYFHRAFIFTGEKESIWEEMIKVLRYVEIDVEGMILLKGKWWVPFSGKHHFSTSILHPGFVNDIQLSLPSPIPLLADLKVYLRDDFFNGTGYKDARFMKVIPVLDSLMLSDPNSGDLLHWLSASPLFPSSLLPHESNGIQWNAKKLSNGLKKDLRSVTTSSANLTDPITSEKVEAEFRFSEDGLISSIFAFTEKRHGDGSISIFPWECHFNDYELMGHGMMVPTKVEYGWLVKGDFQPYYKINYKNLNYTYF